MSPRNNFRITNYNNGLRMRSKETARAKSPIPDSEPRKDETVKEKENGMSLRDFGSSIDDFEIKEVLGFSRKLGVF